MAQRELERQRAERERQHEQLGGREQHSTGGPGGGSRGE